MQYNNKNTKDKRRELRKNQTDAERKLWSILRNRQMCGLKFYRQYSVNNYILDFYCPEKRVCVEADGGQHGENKNIEYDATRTQYLQSQDIIVIRFWNNEILTNIEGVGKNTGGYGVHSFITPPSPSYLKRGTIPRPTTHALYRLYQIKNPILSLLGESMGLGLMAKAPKIQSITKHRTQRV